MVTIEQKINLFSKLIYQDVENEISEKINIVAKQRAQRLEQVKSEANKKAKDIYNTNENKIKRKVSEVVTRAKVDSKHKVLETKEICVNKMMSKLENGLVNLVSTLEYEDYIKACINKANQLMDKNNSLQVIVKNEDAKRFKELLESNNFTVTSTQSPIIGGIIVVDPKNHTRIDLSIKSKLEEIRPTVVNRIMKELWEVGVDIE